ncbi:hypothetical protein Tco_0638450 [Tanacetum coccineum]
MTRTTKAKENASNVEIQIISSENAQNYQETIIKEPTSEDDGVIATKIEKKRLRMKNVLWLKHPISQILKTPYNGKVVFTNERDLESLAYSQETEGPYHTNLPYGMFLTRLYQHVMEHYPHLDNGIYNVVDRVMRPLDLKQTRKPRSDHGIPKAHHSVSSSSAHHYGSSSHHGADNKDDDASRASTPSPTTYLNSLCLLNYQRYYISTSS